MTMLMEPMIPSQLLLGMLWQLMEMRMGITALRLNLLPC